VSTASPAAAHPWRPAIATTSPTWAPLRSTGAVSQVPSTVTAMTTSLDMVRSPPTTLAPTRAASSAIPSARSSAHWAGRSAGAPRPTVSEWAVPPMALMSERLEAAALRPMSRAGAHSRRKCRPSTSRSVETTTWPRGVRSTAASSPGPTYTCGPCSNRPARAETRANSPTSASVRPGAKGDGMSPSHQIAGGGSVGAVGSAPAGRPVGCETVQRFPIHRGSPHGRPGLHPDPDRCRQGR
jgi:hypothetical protein